MDYINDRKVFMVAFGASLPVVIFTKFNFLGLGLEKEISIALLAMIGGLTALAKYSYEKRRDLRLSSIETVSFFREKLMGKSNEYIKKLGVHSHQEYAVPLHTNDISILVKDFSKQIHNQMTVFGNEPSDMRELKYEILNLAEEFALKVKYNNLMINEILLPLHKPYVDMIESHSCAILFVRDLQYGMKAYSNAEELYINWSKILKSTPVSSDKKITWNNILKNLK